MDQRQAAGTKIVQCQAVGCGNDVSVVTRVGVPFMEPEPKTMQAQVIMFDVEIAACSECYLAITYFNEEEQNQTDLA